MAQIHFNWHVPTYAQPLLTTSTDADFVYVHWGTSTGPLLMYAELPTDGKPLDWNGQVIVGGYIQQLHARRIADVDFLIATVLGGAFPTDHNTLLTLDDARRGVFSHADDAEPSGDYIYPFIIAADSHFAALAQDALVSNLVVDMTGRLAEDADRWHEICGLPLILDALTLYAAD